MVRRDANPMRLVWLAIAGAMLAASTWFLIFAPIPRVVDPCRGFEAWLWANRLRILAYLGPGLLGLTISIWAEKAFNRRFQRDQWSETELSRIRNLLAHPAWKFASLALMVLALGSLVLSNRFSKGSLIYILLLPIYTVNRIRQLITPRVSKSSGLADWRSFQPIRSEHWGQPRT